MPFPFGQVAAYAAPTLINLAGNILRPDKPSDYEKRLSKYATMFDEEASQPLTESRTYKAGKKVLDARDEKNRKAINNNSAVTGATDEAKLANIQNANETYDSAVNQLLATAKRYRDVMRGRALQTYGLLNQAEQNRNAAFADDMGRLSGAVSDASNAFLLSKMFASDKPKKWKPRTPAERLPAPPLPTVDFGSIFNV